MALLLRWQPREAILSPAESADQPPETAPVKVEFNFELTPLTLLSDKDRPRLVSLLTQLREQSGQSRTVVDLLIPPSWGIILEVPHPGLPDDQMEDHLLWELSKALLGSVDHYRYGWKEESGAPIRLAALRNKLIDLINQTVKEAGYTPRGLYLDEEGFRSINLGSRRVIREPAEAAVREEPAVLEAAPPPEPVTPPEAVIEPEFAPEPESKHLQEARAEQGIEAEELPEIIHQRFPWKVILWTAAVIILVVIGVKLLTSPKPSGSPEPGRQSETTAKESPSVPTQSQTSAASESTLTQMSTPDTSKTQVAETLSEPAPGEVAAMLEAQRQAGIPTSRRLALLQEFQNQSGETRLDMATFTAGRFLFQLSAPDSGTVQTILERMKVISGLGTVKLKWTTADNQQISATLSGDFTAEAAHPPQARPDSNTVRDLAQKHRLTGGALVFTGPRENVMAFLADMAGSSYTFYRLVFMPWENQQYRLVLDI